VFFKNTKDKWGWLSILFHWLTAFIVVGLFILGLWMVDLTYYDEWYRSAPFMHKSIGVTLFILTVLRIIWRRINEVPEPINTHTDFERKAAGFVHTGLYFLLLAVMLTGYFISTADSRPVDVFGLFKVPAVIHGINNQEDIAGVLHLILASILIGMAVLHGLAAIKHHFINKDRTLKRMFGN